MDNQNGYLAVIKNIKKEDILRAYMSFSKNRLLIFLVFFGVALASLLIILYKVNNIFMVEIPKRGGEIREGVIGTPRFINPVLALSDADRDISALVYSGLMKANDNGDLIPDLAESYEVSKDGLSYIFYIKEKALFQDNEPVTADDVLFTINKVRDPLIKSPKKINWEGVAVEKIDQKTVKFSLKKPFASFLENTTLGILPEHLWGSLSPEEFGLSDYNTSGIGSGPFMVKSIRKSAGIPKSYELEAFNKYSGGRPMLEKIIFNFYLNEKELISALEGGSVAQASALSPGNAKFLEEKGYHVSAAMLPRIFGLFFNQAENIIFSDKKVVEAIDIGINKQRIVENVLLGYGEAIESPLPAELKEFPQNAPAWEESNIEEAKKILATGGWKAGPDGILERSS